MTAPDEKQAPSAARALLVYSLLRLVVFVGATGFFLLLGINGLLLLFLALMVSMVVSVFALRPQRAALVEAVEARNQRRAAERDRLRSRLDEA